MVLLGVFAANAQVPRPQVGPFQINSPLTYLTTPTLTLKGAVGSTGDLFEVKNSAGTLLFGMSVDPILKITTSYAGATISAAGQVFIRNNAGILQVSNDGNGYNGVVLGTGAVNRIAVWAAGTHSIIGVGPLADGELLIGESGAAPHATALTAGGGISVTPGAGTSTIANTGVLSNIGGTGITVSGGTGNVTVNNAGVLSLAGTVNEIVVSGSTGAITIGGAGATVSLSCAAGQAIKTLITSNGILTGATCGAP